MMKKKEFGVKSNLLGNIVRSASAEIVSGEMDDKNTFDEPEKVKQL